MATEEKSPAITAADEQTTAITDLPSGQPVPAPAAPPTPAAKPAPPARSSIGSLIAAAPGGVDGFMEHLQRCLTTPAGMDTLLLVVCYTARFTAGGIDKVVRPALERSAQRLLALASALPPSATLVFATSSASRLLPSSGTATLLTLANRLKALSTLTSEFRTLLRLFGLLPMYFWARGLIRQPRAAAAADPVGTAVAWVQMLSCVAFQALENGAYLSAKGVLGWAPATQAKTAKWAARAWGAFVFVEIGRLVRDSVRRSGRSRAERLGSGDGSGEKTVAQAEAEEAEWNDSWRKNLARNVAWAPLTVHWSVDQGFAGEMLIGALGSIPGIIKMRDLWRETA